MIKRTNRNVREVCVLRLDGTAEWVPFLRGGCNSPPCTANLQPQNALLRFLSLDSARARYTRVGEGSVGQPRLSDVDQTQAGIVDHDQIAEGGKRENAR
jgi:hypothetical protein